MTPHLFGTRVSAIKKYVSSSGAGAETLLYFVYGTKSWSSACPQMCHYLTVAEPNCVRPISSHNAQYYVAYRVCISHLYKPLMVSHTFMLMRHYSLFSKYSNDVPKDTPRFYYNYYMQHSCWVRGGWGLGVGGGGGVGYFGFTLSVRLSVRLSLYVDGLLSTL